MITSGTSGNGYVLTLGGTIYSFDYNNEQKILKSNIDISNATSFDYDPVGDQFYWAKDDSVIVLFLT